jgi:hypothetical protein
MNVDARLDGSRLEDRISTQDEWLALGAWVETVADQTIPLPRIWQLVHLVTYGWADDLKKLGNELVRVLGRDDLPAEVRKVLWALAQCVTQRRSGEDQVVDVVRVG